MKVGFTGTREGMSQHQKEQFALKIYDLNPTEFHHGDCEGADAEAHDIIRAIFPNIKIVVHPPKFSSHRAFRVGDEMREPDAYISRDKRIVEETEYLIGAPLVDKEQIRSGTWTTIRFAKKLNRLYTILHRSAEDV